MMIPGGADTPVCWTEADRSVCSTVGYEVEFEGRREALALGEVWPRLDDLLFLLAAKGRPELLLVHASCVGKDNQTLLLVGGTMHGKTTLALALRTRGWDLLCDDLSPVSVVWASRPQGPLAVGHVLPFLTRPTLRAHTEKLMDGWGGTELAPAHASSEPRPVSHICFLKPPSPSHLPPVATAGRKEEWARMYRLVYGSDPPCSMMQNEWLAQRDERDFAGPPVLLGSVSAFDAARWLLRYAYPSTRTVGETLSALATVLPRVYCFSIQPGALEETLDLLEVQAAEKTSA